MILLEITRYFNGNKHTFSIQFADEVEAHIAAVALVKSPDIISAIIKD